MEMLSQKKPRVGAFLFIAYAISWAFWMGAVAMALSSVGLYVRVSGFVLVNIRVYTVLLILANFGPATAAILLCFIEGRRNGIQDLLRPLLQWKIGWGWYLFALVGPAAVELLVLVLFVVSGNVHQFFPWRWPMRLFLFDLPLACLGEEIGWRGYLLPALESKLGGLRSSLLVGLAWGFWHLPYYLSINRVGNRPFLFFLLFVIYLLPVSMILTLVYNKTNASLVAVMLFHFALDATLLAVYGVIPQLTIEIFVATTIVFWIAALLALAFGGRDLGSTTVRVLQADPAEARKAGS